MALLTKGCLSTQKLQNPEWSRKMIVGANTLILDIERIKDCESFGNEVNRLQRLKTNRKEISLFVTISFD